MAYEKWWSVPLPVKALRSLRLALLASGFAFKADTFGDMFLVQAWKGSTSTARSMRTMAQARKGSTPQASIASPRLSRNGGACRFRLRPCGLSSWRYLQAALLSRKIRAEKCLVVQARKGSTSTARSMRTIAQARKGSTPQASIASPRLSRKGGACRFRLRPCGLSGRRYLQAALLSRQIRAETCSWFKPGRASM